MVYYKKLKLFFFNKDLSNIILQYTSRKSKTRERLLQEIKYKYIFKKIKRNKEYIVL